MTLTYSAYDIALRFVGMKEVSGPTSNPFILGMLQLDAGTSIVDDSTPWCSAWPNFIAWLLRLPRSKSLAARSWLEVGTPITLDEARVGFDVVIIKRGSGTQPGPEVIKAPGHVGFFAGLQGDRVLVLGGNQNDSVSIASFPIDHVLGVRRLA